MPYTTRLHSYKSYNDATSITGHRREHGVFTRGANSPGVRGQGENRSGGGDDEDDEGTLTLARPAL